MAVQAKIILKGKALSPAIRDQDFLVRELNKITLLATILQSHFVK